MASLYDEEANQDRPLAVWPFVIGREAPADGLRLDAPVVSGAHARIERSGSAYVMTDTSTNGTLVQKLENCMVVGTRELKRGDTVELWNGARIVIPARLGPDDPYWTFRFWIGTRTVVSSVRFDPSSGELTVVGRPVELTPDERVLVKALWASVRHTVTFAELLAALGHDARIPLHGPPDRSARDLIGQHVREIRRKIGDDQRFARHLVTVRGVGYRLDPAC